jgi:hypothetical protein
MTTRDEWLALAERCKHPEFDPYLHDALSRAIGSEVLGKKYTESLEAVISVVENSYGKKWRLDHCGNTSEASIAIHRAQPVSSLGVSCSEWVLLYGQAQTDATALMAAYCRAKAEEAGE